MTLRQYLATMIIATLLCYTAWFFVVLNVDPFETSALGLAFFYVSLFLALLGTGSIILFFVNRLVSQGEQPLFRYVQKSWREAFLAAAYLTAMLALLGSRYLSWLTGGLATGIFILILSFSLSLDWRRFYPGSLAGESD